MTPQTKFIFSQFSAAVHWATMQQTGYALRAWISNALAYLTAIRKVYLGIPLARL